MLEALAGQEGVEPFPVVVVDDDRWRDAVPAEFAERFPAVRWVFVRTGHSSGMKDAGVTAVTSDWVAVFEADSVPKPDWMRRISSPEA